MCLRDELKRWFSHLIHGFESCWRHPKFFRCTYETIAEIVQLVVWGSSLQFIVYCLCRKRPKTWRIVESGIRPKRLSRGDDRTKGHSLTVQQLQDSEECCAFVHDPDLPLFNYPSHFHPRLVLAKPRMEDSANSRIVLNSIATYCCSQDLSANVGAGRHTWTSSAQYVC